MLKKFGSHKLFVLYPDPWHNKVCYKGGCTVYSLYCIVKHNLCHPIFGVFQFRDDGYLIIPGFATDTEINSLKNEIHRIVEEMNPEEHNTVFTTLEMKRVTSNIIIYSINLISALWA